MGSNNNSNTVDEFQELAKPLIQYLNDNYHPHATIIINCDSAEVLTGVKSFCIHYDD